MKGKIPPKQKYENLVKCRNCGFMNKPNQKCEVCGNGSNNSI